MFVLGCTQFLRSLLISNFSLLATSYQLLATTPPATPPRDPSPPHGLPASTRRSPARSEKTTPCRRTRSDRLAARRPGGSAPACRCRPPARDQSRRRSSRACRPV